MKNKAFLYIIIITFILLSIGLGVVFAFKNDSSELDTLLEKADQEIKFLEEKNIAMLNKLNQINFLDSILTEEKTKNEKTTSQEEQTQKGDESSKNGSGTSQSSSENSGGSSSESSSKNNETSNSNENTIYEVKKKRHFSEWSQW